MRCGTRLKPPRRNPRQRQTRSLLRKRRRRLLPRPKKLLSGVFSEKNETLARSRGFVVFADVFEGCFEKLRCRTWFFCGEIVVKCVVKRGELKVVFSRRKTCHFL